MVAVQRPGGHVEMDCSWRQTKVSGQDHTGYRSQAAYKWKCWWCGSFSLGPFDLLAPLERCKRERGTADVSREKLNWAPREVPEGESNRTLPALQSLRCAWPSLSVHGAQAGQGGGGGVEVPCRPRCTVLYIRPIKLVDDMNGANQNSAAPLQYAAPRSLPHHARAWVGCNGCQMRY